MRVSHAARKSCAARRGDEPLAFGGYSCNLRRRLHPPTAPPDAARLIATRTARRFADGVASVLLASYLTRLGFTPVQIGAIATATLVGSAALLLAAGLLGHRYRRRTVLLASSALMCATGIAFYLAQGFGALLLVAFV